MVAISVFDVVIVGSGPIGAVFARTLVDKGVKKVLMIDMGEQATRRVGDHKKNSVVVQKDISLFTNTVKGDLRLLSVPTNKVYVSRDPSSWSPETPFTRNGQNPNQKEPDNLPAAAASRVVGGMGSHWTCCTPRQHDLERSDLFNDHEWERYYYRAEALFKTNTEAFDESIRHQLVLSELQVKLPDRKSTIQSMPLACRRVHQDYIEWSCSATILGEQLSTQGLTPEKFLIMPNAQCVRLNVDQGKVTGMMVRLLEDPGVNEHEIIADQYIICAGAILTLGILYNSGFRTEFGTNPPSDKEVYRLPAMGRFMTEQTLSFCQVILRHDLVAEMGKLRKSPESDRFPAKAQKWHDYLKSDRDIDDPIPFPLNDPDPQVCVRFSRKHRWHTQIHRDAFGYGEVPHNIDQRIVVDLRSFGYTDPNKENLVDFQSGTNDGFGMPQPSFKFKMSDDDKARCDDMYVDMVKIARYLGGFLPGAEPKYMPMGSALHICGTYRAGEVKVDSVVDRTGKVTDDSAVKKVKEDCAVKKAKEDSVVDRTGKVHGLTNLVLGGCGVIPTGNACNPTLTAAAFAIAAADRLANVLGAVSNEEKKKEDMRELFEAGVRVFQTFENQGDLGAKEWVKRINSAAQEQNRLRGDLTKSGVTTQLRDDGKNLDALQGHLCRIGEAVGKLKPASNSDDVALSRDFYSLKTWVDTPEAPPA
ncbi:hypothetical protein DL767_002329 [Monosporascus sp. MG133]|nr:hypothetical protein DL767_002329 [Monosporascus sp. MG133]